jgi:hypothetical protein
MVMKVDINTYIIHGSTACSRELSVQFTCFIDGIVVKHPFHCHITNHEDDEASALRGAGEKESLLDRLHPMKGGPACSNDLL